MEQSLRRQRYRDAGELRDLLLHASLFFSRGNIVGNINTREESKAGAGAGAAKSCLPHCLSSMLAANDRSIPCLSLSRRRRPFPLLLMHTLTPDPRDHVSVSSHCRSGLAGDLIRNLRLHRCTARICSSSDGGSGQTLCQLISCDSEAVVRRARLSLASSSTRRCQ